MAKDLTPEQLAIIKQMDAAANVADKELRQIPHDASMLEVPRWFARHYMQAGHKRLGRILASYAKETVGVTP